ncbi:ABC transporter substrate-binding protein [Helcobacillus massiliensis]|uniref:ABC transporter substrate-binding protein n=1 Tax=Helcobacillus massiliensis TaxID=521392 RepID=UPI0021A6A42D|nr:ABC transporter substrate-binding protein [Helcobacillus massiliensis]MCT1557739.1 ABC transporter substrate-binding protein [Helcobacillus massiliensis]MCT2036011.1 ABC transporter substrate-binding protein [Helcobacillus massiliensis]MCT2331719.1 ABC transporter substrate-binding protein [Helcobacillus massiliensis]
MTALSRRSLLTATAAGTAAAALAACGPAVTGKGKGADGSSTIRVGHLPSSLFAPLYVADATKKFADAGLTLELVPLKSGQDGVPMLANNQLDVMCAGFSAGMFNALHSGVKFTVAGSMGISPGDIENSPTALEVSQKLLDSGEVKDVKDLKGRKIGVAGGPGATGGYLLAAMLKEAGLTLNDVEAVNLATPDQQPALENGSIDAATPSAPFSSAMEEAGIASPIAVPAKGVTGTGVMFSEDFAAGDTAQKFFTALTEGAQQLSADGPQTDEVYQILADATGQKIEVLEASPMYTYLPNLAPQPEQLEAMQAVWMEAKQVSYSEPLKVADFVDEKFSASA